MKKKKKEGKKKKNFTVPKRDSGKIKAFRLHQRELQAHLHNFRKKLTNKAYHMGERRLEKAAISGRQQGESTKKCFIKV